MWQQFCGSVCVCVCWWCDSDGEDVGTTEEPEGGREVKGEKGDR